jgi:predicted small lipoprotein YifL
MPSDLRLLVIVALIGLGLAACGRRGPLEPPPDPTAAKPAPTATAQGPVDLSDDGSSEPPGQGRDGTPRSSGSKRGYTIPKTPFILDPLL